MARIGLLGRITLIVMLALATMVAINVGIGHLARENQVSRPGSRFPRVVHAAGLIALEQTADAARRKEVARLGEFGIVHVDIVDVPPKPAPDDIAAPHLGARLLDVLGTPLPGLEAFTNTRMKHPAASHSSVEGQLTKVFAPLGGGRTLVIEWLDPPSLVGFTFLGLAPGAWTGILGLAVAALALVGTSHEMRPLRRLAAAVSVFDGRRSTLVPADEGAPDIRRLAEAVRGMQQRVAALLAERSFLIGAISHDLRTYLTRLRLRIEAIAEGETRERLIGDLDMMTHLVDASLVFARGTTTLQTRRPVDLGDLVAIEVEEQNALGSRLALEGSYENNAIVFGDATALRRVVANLLDNAQKFGRNAVHVRVERGSQHRLIVVEDDGPGIPEPERDRVFDPFHRADPGRVGGTGLGLAIARQIVEAHGGTIAVADAEPGGTSIRVTLPRHPA